ncbi:MAG: ketoacyl-ACP synthase III [Fibrobacterales bacterium]
MKAYIRGIDVYLPEKKLTNFDMEKIVDTNDEWIRTRTGIEERRIEEDQTQTTSEIGARAAKKLIDRLGVDPSEIDGIIAGSMFPDKTFPANACLIQDKLGCTNAFAYDITAACAFIPFAYNSAALQIQAGQAKNILVIGSELSSRVVDWKDRNTCILFGDAAAATLISVSDDESRGFEGSELKSRGSLSHILDLPQLGKADSYMTMDGSAVFKLAVKELAAITQRVLERAGYTTEDIDLFVPHQANIRIIEAAGKRLGLPIEKVMVNVQKYGNTSSASIPLALYEAEEEGRLKKGDLVAVAGIGGGMSWGCNVFKW